MSQWQETYRVPATITLSEGTTIEGDIHLQTGSALHGGGETAVEMLNRPERFFAVTLPSDDVTLVSKVQAAVVTCDASLWEVDAERRTISRTFVLDVRLINGHKLCGSTYWELPPTHPRPQDLLNAAENFFEVFEGDSVHCVNRALVSQANPLE